MGDRPFSAGKNDSGSVKNIKVIFQTYLGKRTLRSSSVG